MTGLCSLVGIDYGYKGQSICVYMDSNVVSSSHCPRKGIHTFASYTGQWMMINWFFVHVCQRRFLPHGSTRLHIFTKRHEKMLKQPYKFKTVRDATCNMRYAYTEC